MGALLSSVGGLAGPEPKPDHDGYETSFGPLTVEGLDPTAEREFLWRAASEGMAMYRQGRLVGRVLEFVRWPLAQGDVPAETLWACVAWMDPYAATAEDLTLNGQPVRLLAG